MFYYYLFGSLLSIFLSVNGYEVTLEQNGPIIIGGTINFWAKINGSNSSQYKYTWTDIKRSLQESFISNQPTNEWNLTYTKGKDPIGKYVVELEVCEHTLFIYWPCTKHQTIFNVTGDLNGKIEFIQNNTIQDSDYVSNHTEVVHNITIKSTDINFLEDNNFTAVAFWFLNCSYYGMSPDLVFRFNYTTADEDTTVKAVIVAAKLNETSNLTDAFSDKPGVEGSWDSSNVSTTVLSPWPDGSCQDSFIPKDPDKYYGYYHRVVKPRRPIQVSEVKGNNWLKNGDLLDLTLTFSGSPPYLHCIKFITGEYNATGNERCIHPTETPPLINVVHYFGTGEKHTVLFIIENNVSRKVNAVVVTNYIAKKHAQLSVIIVPISFTALAVILIVFGVAYYIQSKKRYTIEVANFDFSASNDTEYKSFKDRLREAMSSAFTRVTEEESEEGPYWSPSRKPAKNAVQFENSDTDSQDSS